MNKSKKIYAIYYVYEYPNGYEDSFLLGLFSTRAKAKKALEKIRKQAVIFNIKKGFRIYINCIDWIGWQEGYITYKP